MFGALTLALLFGLFNLIYGVSALTQGIELRRTGKTLHSLLSGPGAAGANAGPVPASSRR